MEDYALQATRCEKQRMPMIFPADVILIAHVLYVSVVVFSVPLILIGAWRHWGWVHNFWFRAVHLLMILIVVAESFLGISCPLTVWESALRRSSAQQAYQGDFIATWLDRLMFYHFPHWVFTAAYTIFGLLVFSLFFIVPVKRRSRRATPDRV